MKRPGFTLVELIVVLGIIGTVLALLIPALRGGAEAARRVQCLNNLKQIHLGLQSYHATHSVYPPGVVDVVRPFSATNAERRSGWPSMILPWVEQRAIYDTLNFDVASTDPANSTARRCHMNTFACPDSSPARSAWGRASILPIGWSTPPPEFGRSSYVACHNDAEKAIDADDHGVFFLNSRVSRRDLVDGPAFTILAGEVRSSIAYGGWAIGTAATLRNTGWNLNGEGSPDFALAHRVGSGRMRGNGRDFDPVVLQAMIESGELAADVVGGFGSAHATGANFLFGDGSVRFLKDRIARPVLQALAHRSDGEIVDGDAY